jgi:hypothetical protein
MRGGGMPDAWDVIMFFVRIGVPPGTPQFLTETLWMPFPTSSNRYTSKVPSM